MKKLAGCLVAWFLFGCGEEPDVLLTKRGNWSVYDAPVPPGATYPDRGFSVESIHTAIDCWVNNPREIFVGNRQAEMLQMRIRIVIHPRPVQCHWVVGPSGEGATCAKGLTDPLERTINIYHAGEREFARTGFFHELTHVGLQHYYGDSNGDHSNKAVWAIADKFYEYCEGVL